MPNLVNIGIGVGWANTEFLSQFSVLPFVGFFVFVFFASCPGHTAGPITTRDGSWRVFFAKEVPFGSR